jgi:hypothetical protein
LHQLRTAPSKELISMTSAKVPAREERGYLLYLRRDESGGFEPTSGQSEASLSIRITSRTQRPLSRTPPNSRPLTVRL